MYATIWTVFRRAEGACCGGDDTEVGAWFDEARAGAIAEGLNRIDFERQRAEAAAQVEHARLMAAELTEHELGVLEVAEVAARAKGKGTRRAARDTLEAAGYGDPFAGFARRPATPGRGSPRSRPTSPGRSRTGRRPTRSPTS